MSKRHPEIDHRGLNLCPLCDGKKAFYFPMEDEKGNIIDGPDGLGIDSDKLCCYCVCDDGTYVGYQDYRMEMQKREKDKLYEEFNNLRFYILRTSTCKSCKGDINHTLGFGNCPECGLPGQLPIMGG